MTGSHDPAIRRLPATVLVLGAVSFLTDLSSEMIYPLLPVFLATVLAAGPVALGWIEGVAESTAAFVKLAAGLRSDRVRRRKPLILGGYALAGLVRPLIGLATSWLAVLGLRFADRIGKGLRTAPRDALIADVTEPEQRGHAFGVQRTLDHAGAVAGPLVAAALLTWAGLGLRAVFLLAAVPAALMVVVIVLGVREAPRANAAPLPRRCQTRPNSTEAGRAPSPTTPWYRPSAVPRRPAGASSLTQARSTGSVSP